MRALTNPLDHDLRPAICEVAEGLFAQVGFHKTTVADIARELRMSPANVYRFFDAKAEINEAVARHVLSGSEAAVAKVAAHSGSASQKLRACIAAINDANAQRYLSNRKLHELVEAAFNGRWSIARDHVETMHTTLSEIISQGNRDGEFNVDDSDLAAILVHSACMRFCDPRVMVEYAEEAEPTRDQMIDFASTLSEKNDLPLRESISMLLIQESHVSKALGLLVVLGVQILDGHRSI